MQIAKRCIIVGMAVTQLYNFNAGPAILPRAVLEQAQAEEEMMTSTIFESDRTFFSIMIHLIRLSRI